MLIYLVAKDFRRLNHDKVNRKRVTSHNLNTSWCRELNMRNGVSLKTRFGWTHQLFFAEKNNRFSSNYTRYCQLGVRNWSECVRSQFYIRRRETHA